MFSLSQKMIGQCVDAMQVAVYSIDASGYCIECNDQAIKLLGYDFAEMQSRQSHFFHVDREGKTLPIAQCPLCQPHPQGSIFQKEPFYFRTRKGKVISVRLIAETCYQDDLVQTSTVLFQDISMAMQLEQELEKARQQVALTEQLKNNFLANMSHELRTPLNVIMGMTQLVRQSSVDEQQDNYLQKIEHSSVQLLQLINDILALSQLDSGTMVVKQTRFSLYELFEEIEQELLAKAQKKQLELFYTIDPQLPAFFYGDVLKIKKILINLIKNALKFTQAGMVMYTVERKDSENLCFHVYDSGIGMTEEQLQQLFTADFHQLDSNASRQYNGMGMGLGYSQKLIQLLGGSITADSVYGQGSHFSFVLPLQAADNADQLDKIYLIHRALIVEDNKINQMVIKNLLSRLNFQVEVAENGLEAIEKVNAEYYDLVLMDLNMPQMGGLEATRVIRETHQNRELLIIALTASNTREDQYQCFMAGMNDVLFKPVRPDQLNKVLVKWNLCTPEQFDTHGKEQPDEVELPAVEVLDMQQGLLRLANNKKLYRQLLEDFATHYQSYDQQIRELADQKKWQEAIRHAHSIKGVAANIGAVVLSDYAAKLEQNIKQGGFDENIFQAFSQRLQLVIKQLKQAGYADALPESSQTPTETGQQQIAAEIIAIVEDMKAKLVAYDGDCEDFLQRVKPRLEEVFPAQMLDDIQKAIQRFDFELAIDYINQLLGDKG